MILAKTFITQARKRTKDQADKITYRVIDATDRTQLLGLGEDHFDAVVCNQAFMDMATLLPLFAALSSILKLQGRFVFTLAHPCFQSPGAIKMVEEEDRDGEIVVRRSIKTSTYITPHHVSWYWYKRSAGTHTLFSQTIESDFSKLL